MSLNNFVKESLIGSIDWGGGITRSEGDQSLDSELGRANSMIGFFFWQFLQWFYLIWQED